MTSPSAASDIGWLRSVFQSGLGSDCTIKAKGSDKHFQLHKIVLISRSRVFEKMLDPAGAFKESCSGGSPVEIGDVTDEALSACFGFLYGIALPVNNIRLTICIAEFGHRMEIETLETAAAEIISDQMKREKIKVLNGSERTLEFLHALEIGRRTENRTIYSSAIAYIYRTHGFAVGKKESWITEELRLEDVSLVLRLFLSEVEDNQSVAGYTRRGCGKAAAALEFIYQWAGLLTDQSKNLETGKDNNDSTVYLSCPRVMDGSLRILFGLLDFDTASIADIAYIQNAMDETGTSSSALGQKLALKLIQELTKLGLKTTSSPSCLRCLEPVGRGYCQYCYNILCHT